MKKFLSVVIAAMITMACTVFPAFATGDATADTASPDEAVAVSSIEITKNPDKLTYIFGKDVDWDYDSITLGDLMKEEEEYLETLKDVGLKFTIDLTGIEVVATYTDNTTANVPADELTSKVTNTLTIGEIYEIAQKYMPEDENADVSDEDIDKYLEEIITAVTRDYIVEVEYKGATDTYAIKIDETTLDDSSDYDSNYELVSFTAPDKTVYDMANKDEVIIEDWSDEDGEYFFYDVDIQTEGLTATIRNKETGETQTVSGDDIMTYFDYSYSESGKLKPGEYKIQATAFTEDYNYVDFEFPITIIDSSQKAEKPEAGKPSDDDSKSEVSSPDSAKPESDNTAIKTGSASNVTFVLSVVLVMTVGVVLFWYKKRVTE